MLTGEIALPRELGALDGPVLSDVSFEGSAIVRAGGVDTPIAGLNGSGNPTLSRRETVTLGAEVLPERLVRFLID